ncbi:glycosyltransferase family 9 protein [Micromonospora sonneratiae]|uniref:Glycosyltransferase family 9 protein n=1 Tax=Micromonospora sonneratiae TaxID=1184706 RepID=A0ABW3YNR5_9ACTN
MILVLRALGVGDLATAVPALRGLRAAFPDQEVALAVPDWLAPLVDLIGCVDRVVPTDGLTPREWGIPSPYLAVNLHGQGPQSHQLLLAADPQRLGAFACPAADHHDGPHWDPDEHEVLRWCRLLAWYGIAADPTDLGLRRPSPHRVPVGVTIVHPGAKAVGKRWAPGRFAALARELTGQGHRVVVTGSAAERGLAERVVSGAGLPGTSVLAGRIDLAELAALVAHGRLVVSADTGIAHLATAYGTPSVVLFGPVSPYRWGPPPDRPWHRTLWTQELTVPAGSSAPARAAGAGGPEPWRRDTPALASISLESVLDAVGEADRAGRERSAVTAK